jgi:hypothetical protein
MRWSGGDVRSIGPPASQCGTERWPSLFDPFSQAEVALRTILITTICWALSCGFATAQADPKKDLNTPTGRSAPEEKGQLQPQGWTGPVCTENLSSGVVVPIGNLIRLAREAESRNASVL